MKIKFKKTKDLFYIIGLYFIIQLNPRSAADLLIQWANVLKKEHE